MSPKKLHLSRRWPTAIDLFCGCGGVTAGLKTTRFRVIAAVDNDPLACRTYRSNHPSVRLIERDITQIDPWSLKASLLKDANLDLLVVCAPCQPFSSHQRYVAADDRISLSIARTYGPVVARVIEPPCGPVDGLLSPLGLRVNHLLSVEQGPVG